MLVPRNIFRLHQLADSDSSRYALCGVHLSRGKNGIATATVTDGRCAVVCDWQEPLPSSYTDHAQPGFDVSPSQRFAAVISANDCKAALKLPVGRNPRPALAMVALGEVPLGEPVPMATTNGETVSAMKVSPVEGRFPDLSSVAPVYTPANAVTVGISAKRLAAVLEALAAHAGDVVTLALDRHEADVRPIVLSAADAEGRRAFGVAMPVSVGSGNGCPALPYHPWADDKALAGEPPPRESDVDRLAAELGQSRANLAAELSARAAAEAECERLQKVAAELQSQLAAAKPAGASPAPAPAPKPRLTKTAKPTPAPAKRRPAAKPTATASPALAKPTLPAKPASPPELIGCGNGNRADCFTIYF